MGGSVAIEMNREALTRIVASLVAMAGGRPVVTRHVWRAILSLLRPAESAARRLIIAAARGIVVPPPKPRSHAPQLKSAPPAVEPMRLSGAPAPNPGDREAFLRRFGIAVTGTPPPPRFTRSPAGASHLSRPSFGPPVNGGGSWVTDGRNLGSFTVKRDALILPCEAGEGDHAQRGGGGMGEPSPPRIPAFPLFDPPRRLRLGPARRYVPAHAAPRIMFPGITQPHRLPPPPPPPSPDDQISAAGVARRLAALAAALDDLPKQARRFARLKARMDAQAAQARIVAEASEAGGSAPPSARRRFRRTSPLRGGPPYGGRLAVWDPTVPHGKHIREVDVILAHAHALADYALAFPDTS